MVSDVLLPSKLKGRPRNTCPLIQGRPLTGMNYSSVGAIRSAQLKWSNVQVPSDYHILQCSDAPRVAVSHSPL